MFVNTSGNCGIAHTITVPLLPQQPVKAQTGRTRTPWAARWAFACPIVNWAS